ncbi:conserved hypothetical protein [Pediculus humanus corporis]|uniref:Uncharacterized protein n=1 Tax=Pediculus humanus subsp. corporis TaxID=121224 RepID=E0VE68_PEDHC|nr:uncharacterized protein Phum_PHUM128670 [Pediculus humanus corporis]EEB11674.1 conserved hypothetical protein [Pediculus humanus corporis]
MTSRTREGAAPIFDRPDIIVNTSKYEDEQNSSSFSRSGRPEYEGRSLSYDRTGDYHVKKHETYNSRGEDRERDHRVRDRKRTSRDVNRERGMRNNRSRMRMDPDNFRNTSRDSYRERTRDSEEDRYREKSRSRQRMSNSNAHSNKFTPTETSVQDSSRRYSDPTASYFNSGPRYEVEPRGENFSNYFNSNNRRNNGGNHSARGRGNLVRPIMNRPFLHHTEFGTMRPVPPGAFRGPAPMGPRLAVPGRRVLPRMFPPVIQVITPLRPPGIPFL